MTLYQQNILQNRQAKEEKIFVKEAMFSHHSKGRFFPVEEDGRSAFMRDRDRIIHSASFRRMKDKAQVFLLSNNDMVRTRLTHTLEVAQVSRAIADALNLNEVLTEAIALGHDIGHTPFGHIGERSLSKICARWFADTGKKLDFNEVDFLNSGIRWVDIPLKGFRHNIQSLRVVDFLEKKGEGLNLTYEVRDGILKHSKWGGGILASDPKYLPCTLEGQIVRIADRIAYVNHDLEDSFRSKRLVLTDIPEKFFKVLGTTHSERIGRAIMSVIEHFHKEQVIKMDEDLATHIDELYQGILREKIYQSPEMKSDSEKVEHLIEELAEYYLSHPDVIEETTQDISYPAYTNVRHKIIDHIANMTDHFIIREFERLRIPKSWAGF